MNERELLKTCANLLYTVAADDAFALEQRGAIPRQIRDEHGNTHTAQELYDQITETKPREQRDMELELIAYGLLYGGKKRKAESKREMARLGFEEQARISEFARKLVEKHPDR